MAEHSSPTNMSSSPEGGEGDSNAKSLERSTANTATTRPDPPLSIGQDTGSRPSTSLTASSSSADSDNNPCRAARRANNESRREDRSDNNTTAASEADGPLLRPRRRELSNLVVAENIVARTAGSSNTHSSGDAAGEPDDVDQQESRQARRHVRIPSESAFSPREREWHFLSLVADEILEGIDDDEDDDDEEEEDDEGGNNHQN